MSKQEALKNNDVQIDKWPDTRKLIYKSMDDFAEQEAIAFAEWIINSKYCMNSMAEWFSYDSEEKPTSKQLYQIYKQ